jgi:hypothetical protein
MDVFTQMDILYKTEEIVKAAGWVFHGRAYFWNEGAAEVWTEYSIFSHATTGRILKIQAETDADAYLDALEVLAEPKRNTGKVS